MLHRRTFDDWEERERSFLELPDGLVELQGLDPRHNANARRKSALFEMAFRIGCTPNELRHRVSRDEFLDMYAYMRVKGVLSG